MGRKRKNDEDDFDEQAFLERLATNITKVRSSQGVSQDRLTDEAGLSRGALSKIERAQASPKVATLARIAHALGIPLRKLTDVEVE